MSLTFFSLPRRRQAAKKAGGAPPTVDLFDFLLEAQLEQYYSSLTRDLQLTRVAQLNRVADWQLRDCGLTPIEARRLRRQLRRECPQSAMSRLRRLLFPAHQDHQQLVQQKPPQLQAQQPQVLKHRPSAFGLTSLSIQAGPLSSTLPSMTSSSRSPLSSIPGDRLRLGRCLGSGRFAEVRQATLVTRLDTDSIPAPSTAVAVKILQLSPPDPEAWKRRIEGLMALEHPGLVKVLGWVDVASDEWMWVTEIAPLRSLLDCLRDDTLLGSFHVGALCEFSQQAAQALSYLENRRLPHGCLAARNILVFAKDRVKVADAGLLRELRPTEPDAWTAPELFVGRRVCDRATTVADVWSFGVTLWEAFAYGGQPWTELSGDRAQLESALTTGYRLDRPDACPAAHYQLMQQCWKFNPAERPTFARIASHLPKIIPEKLIAAFDSAVVLDACGRKLSFRSGDVVIVLDDVDDQGGSCQLGIRVGDRQAGRFDRRLTRPLLPNDTLPSIDATLASSLQAPSGAASEMSGGDAGITAAAADIAGGPSKKVARRATLGASYAKEFGQKITRVKKAAQARLQSIGGGHGTAGAPSPDAVSEHQQEKQPNHREREDCALHPPDTLALPFPSAVERSFQRRPRLTSAMISEPVRAEFRHTGHVGFDGSVFGDVSCLAELELTPTCEPPPQQLGAKEAAAAPPDDGNVRYRSPRRLPVTPAASAASTTLEVVDALRCQSGYCRLGSSLSLGVETIGGGSSAASASGSYLYVDGGEFEDEAAWDWEEGDVGSDDGRGDAAGPAVGIFAEVADVGGDTNNNNSNTSSSVDNNDSSLIDEILRAWCSVTNGSGGILEATAAAEARTPTASGENDTPPSAVDSPASASNSVANDASLASDGSSKEEIQRCPGDAPPVDGVPRTANSDESSPASTTATPSTSVSSLNNGAALTASEEQLLDLPDVQQESPLQPQQEQQEQEQQQQLNPPQQLYVSTLVTASSSCSSSLSSVGSDPTPAEAAVAERRSASNSPRLLLAAAAVTAPPPLLMLQPADGRERDGTRVVSCVHSDDEDIVDI